VRFIDPLGTCIIEMFVVPTGLNNDGHFYHSFLVLTDNSGTLPSRANPTRVFRGQPSPGVPPLVDATYFPLNYNSIDQPSAAVFLKSLLTNDCSCTPYLDTLNKLIQDIDKSHTPYTPTHNSNSVTSTAIDRLNLTPPEIPFLVRSRLWGWGNPLFPPTGGGW
jgi:hypothetical protein